MSRTLAIVNGDIFVNPRGTGDWIEGRDKLSQDFAELVLSDEDPSHDWGTRLKKVVVGTGAARSFVTSELHKAAAKLQRHQQNDQACTPEERLASVSYLNVEVSGNDCDFQMTLKTQAPGSLTLRDGIQLRTPKLGHTMPNYSV
jgi:hypothetical protein